MQQTRLYPAPMKHDACAARFKLARESAHLTQEEVARALVVRFPYASLSQQALSSFEKSTGRSGYLVELALIVGVNPIWLATGEGPRELDALARIPCASEALALLARMTLPQASTAIAMLSAIVPPQGAACALGGSQSRADETAQAYLHEPAREYSVPRAPPVRRRGERGND